MRVLVVGAGPAGLMAAVAAAHAGAEVVVFERLPKPGRKLLATGGGRCNLTNTAGAAAIAAAFGRDKERFARRALAAFGPEDLRDFLAAAKVPTKAVDGFHVFPASERASDVLDALLSTARSAGAEVRTGAMVTGLLVQGDALAGLRTSAGEEAADRCVLACGGPGYPLLGAGPRAWDLAAQAGHAVIRPVPAMVPLVCADPWLPSCAGLVLRAALRLEGAPRAQAREGEVLFTHRGVSGPATLDVSGEVAARLATGEKPVLLADLEPGTGEEAWLARFSSWQAASGARLVRTLLGAHVPAKLAAIICDLAGSAERRAADLSKDQRRRLAVLLRGLPLFITGTEGWDKAMVARGGVPLAEVDPSTLASRRLPGLFLAGEMLDLDGPCGGYNLQWAFSSGQVAGTNAARRGKEER